MARETENGFAVHQQLGVPASRVPAMIGIGKTKTFALIKSGKLESIKIGSSRIVTMRSINALLYGEAA